MPAPLPDGALGSLSAHSADVFSARLVEQVLALMLLRVIAQALRYKVVPEGTFDLLEVLGLDGGVGEGMAAWHFGYIRC